ncbi:MAG: hypothetical protein PHW38_05065 [Candidatus Cloacimonetes bacterium]
MKTYTLSDFRIPAGKDIILENEIARELHIPVSSFKVQKIVRKALDTRKKDYPVWVLTLQLEFYSSPPVHPALSEIQPLKIEAYTPILVHNPHPYIIGMGPAGLFCALAMVENGFKPWLFDKGDSLEERLIKVQDFWQKGILDENSNVQFGEGGAGTFSDGKLTSRRNDALTQRIYSELIKFGTPEEIAYEALPHLGTDGIQKIVKRIREYLITKGCKFHYRTPLTDIKLSEGKVSQVAFGNQWQEPEIIILALGNAARNTWKMLYEREIALAAKPFAIGFRIEQKQSDINRWIYGNESWSEILGPASYRLACKTGFTFCMCPGGNVILASSENNTVVTNGMSFSARKGIYGNSAIVTAVSAKDYGTGIWDGMKLQIDMETKAFHKGYLAPAQKADDFLQNKDSFVPLYSTCLPGIYPFNLNRFFPSSITSRLSSTLKYCNHIFPGFYTDAILVAPETRTSSPIKILRKEDYLSSLSASNLYPIGEGSGYSGGIISSAADGWRLGERFRIY